MTGATTTAQWLTCAGIGTGGGTAVLLLLKVALDSGDFVLHLPHRAPRPRPVSPPPAPAGHGRHAGPAALDETAALSCVRPSHARHSKGGPTWT